jgi:hypothetical protein
MNRPADKPPACFVSPLGLLVLRILELLDQMTVYLRFIARIAAETPF